MLRTTTALSCFCTGNDVESEPRIQQVLWLGKPEGSASLNLVFSFDDTVLPDSIMFDVSTVACKSGTFPHKMLISSLHVKRQSGERLGLGKLPCMLDNSICSPGAFSNKSFEKIKDVDN